MSAKKVNVAASSCQILNLFTITSNYVVRLVCVHSPINPIQPLEKKPNQFELKKKHHCFCIKYFAKNDGRPPGMIVVETRTTFFSARDYK